MRITLVLFVAFHLLLGYVSSVFKEITFYYGALILFAGIADILFNTKKKNRAALWAAYFMGLEVFLRMTNGFIFWESGKYGVCLFLVLGMLNEYHKKEIPVVYVWFFLLLLPSLLVIDFPDFGTAREEVSFNLSGPLTLAVSAIYFYRRPIHTDDLLGILRFAALPLISMMVYLILVTPDLSEIEFHSQSNFTASAGFGPNQVSTLLGLGIFLIGTLLFYRKTFSGYVILDVAILVVFAIRGLSTFSRGGMIGGLLGLAILVFMSVLSSKQSGSILRVFSFLLLALPVGLYAWDYVSEVSEGRLEYRYTGRNVYTGMEKDITSGRSAILAVELKSFLDNPILGIGPGMGLIKNTLANNKVVAHSHSEYSRLLSEHGIFGVVSLLLFVIFPFVYIFKLSRSRRALPLAIMIYVLFTMFHSAMRLAMPGFLYGLCFIALVPLAISNVKGKMKTVREKA